MAWKENHNGNFIKFFNGIICTVFQRKNDEKWAYVYDGVFSEDSFDIPEEAQRDAEFIYEEENTNPFLD